MNYPLDLTKDDNGTFLVTCPVLPEVTSFGETWADAIQYGGEAVEEALAARMSRWEDIPVPDAKDLDRALKRQSVTRISLIADMKVMLYLACKEAGVTRAELARRLGWHREQIDRLFRLDHNSRPDQIEAAVRAIGRNISTILA